MLEAIPSEDGEVVDSVVSETLPPAGLAGLASIGQQDHGGVGGGDTGVGELMGKRVDRGAIGGNEHDLGTAIGDARGTGEGGGWSEQPAGLQGTQSVDADGKALELDDLERFEPTLFLHETVPGGNGFSPLLHDELAYTVNRLQSGIPVDHGFGGRRAGIAGSEIAVVGAAEHAGDGINRCLPMERRRHMLVRSGFQAAVGDVLDDRLRRAAARFHALHGDGGTLVVAGGVAANRYLGDRLSKSAQNLGLGLVVPPPALCTDNGAMVARKRIFRS